MTNDERYVYWISAVRQSIAEAVRDQEHLKALMAENRRQLTEYRGILQRLEDERRMENERAHQGHADVEPSSAVG